MKKIELLSPVGNIEMLESAINNGALAVYLSGTKYGARAFARNFNNDEIKKAIEYAHIYGVVVYVTVNTLIYESEVNDFIKYIEFLYKSGADALIMQDIGMITLVKQMFPNIDIHASVQCHNHNIEGIKLLKSIGVSRVVVAREMDIREINSINIDIEIEAFVYGALCVCYSGCCLFSSLNGGRSANRGECVGNCRLPYKLVKNNEIINLENKYLLSTKDLNTTNYIDELLNSNIDSLKIEGRMKSPYYVGYVTRLYRRLIDNYYNNKIDKVSNIEENNLKKIFNREYTKGYIFNDNSIMNTKSPNHQGIVLGKVINKNKKYVYIKLLNDNINMSDAIRFKSIDKGMIVNKLYNDKLLLVSSINKGNICVVSNKFNPNIGEIVLKTIDKKLIDTINNYPKKKIGINFIFKAIIGKKLEVCINDGINTITEYGNIVESAIKREVSNEDITKLLNKTNDTPFIVNDITINKDDNIFINLKDINIIRRKLINKLIDKRKVLNRNILINNKIDIPKLSTGNNINISVLIRNEEQLKVCISNNIDTIYTEDYNLYSKYKDKYNIYYRISRVESKYNDLSSENLLIGDLSAIFKYKDSNNIVSDYFMNVTNIYSVVFLNNLGINKYTLSVELNDNEIGNIMKYNPNIELIIYGRMELMVTKYCPLKENLNYCNKCNSSKDKFYLMDKSNRKYPIERNECITHIMQYDNMDKIDNISKYLKMGINNYRIDLFDEDSNEVNNIIKRIKNIIR